MTRDKQGNVIFLGMALQQNDTLPVVQHTGSYWQPLKAGNHDLFISAFNQADSLIYSTHIGGSDMEISGGVTSFDDYLFITGYSKSGLANTIPYPLANLGGTPAAWWQPDNYTGTYSTGVISRFNFSTTLYVGIEELQNTNNNSSLVSVYPNPSNGTVYLKFKTNINEKILVEVYDILGRNMYLKSFNNITENQVEQLDLSNYTNGMYLIKISSNKQQECIKIIKER
ncbi:MAG: T9SS type A sorting domain-containing protein [Bacteroidetes bacterium]|nr:T9SS type A sorting domain-containing protein [Bacteroidota bacterium]